MLETENLNTKFQPIGMKELNLIAIYTQIASGHMLLAVLRLRFFQKLKLKVKGHFEVTSH